MDNYVCATSVNIDVLISKLKCQDGKESHLPKLRAKSALNSEKSLENPSQPSATIAASMKEAAAAFTAKPCRWQCESNLRRTDNEIFWDLGTGNKMFAVLIETDSERGIQNPALFYIISKAGG